MPDVKPLDTTHKIIDLAPGVKFAAWTFGDHAIVVRAAEQQHRVAFFALAGPLSAQDTGTQHAIERAVESTYGVDPHSTRVSMGNAALSFAFNPKAAPFALVHRTLARKLSARGVSLELLRTMDRPANLNVIGSRR